MKVAAWLILSLVVFSASLVAGIAARRWQTSEDGSTPAVNSLARGSILYNMHCARCHGDEGHGDAEGAEKLVPPPRDFASRPWRFTPTAPSIEKTIVSGIPGTSMPAFGITLTDADLKLLTEYVLRLSLPNASHTAEPDRFQAAKFSRLKSPRVAPKLQLQSVGSALTLDELRGKVVLLNFWGTSCEHCLVRMPELAELQRRLEARDVTIINICADEEDPAVAQAMLTKVAPLLTTYVDPTGLGNSRFEVSLLPTIWLIDRNGQLVGKAQGARNWNDPALQDLLESLLLP